MGDQLGISFVPSDLGRRDRVRASALPTPRVVNRFPAISREPPNFLKSSDPLASGGVNE
jgi:hypothetical protein